MLVTNETLLPLELSSLVPLGKVHVLRSPRVFVVAKPTDTPLHGDPETAGIGDTDGRPSVTVNDSKARQDISGFPLPSADVTRSSIESTPVRWTPSFPSHACSPVNTLRDYTCLPHSRKKILLWLPPDKNAIERELILGKDTWANLGLTVEAPVSIKNDHPTPCLWVSNSTDRVIHISKDVPLGYVYSVFKPPSMTMSVALKEQSLTELQSSEEARDQLHRNLTLIQRSTMDLSTEPPDDVPPVAF